MILPAQAYTFEDSDFLLKKMESVRSEYQIPGMAVAIVENGEIVNKMVSGIKQNGSSELVEMSDTFQIGSITKPITATLANILSEKGILPMKTKIVDIFPEFKKGMRPEYKNVTVEMLLTHMAGFPYQPSTEGVDEFLNLSSDIKKRRYEYVRAALKDKPEGKVGETYVYSGGTIIVAAMMEKKTKKTWEQLVQKYVFNPLSMTSAGFGTMSDEGVMTEVAEPHAPAGRNLYMNIEDLAVFMISSFPYKTDGVKLVSRQTLLNMEKKVKNANTSAGWFVEYEQWSDWKTVFHSGDNGKNISVLVFAPKYNSGYVITANIAGEKAWQGVEKLQVELKSYLQEKNLAMIDAPSLVVAKTALSYNAPAEASNIYAGMDDYSAGKALDGLYNTRWATDEGVKDAYLEVDLGQVKTVKTILIKEEFSPRVSSFNIQAKSSKTGKYVKVAEGKEIGGELVIFPKTFKARFVRLNLKVNGNSGPTISEFQLFKDKIQVK